MGESVTDEMDASGRMDAERQLLVKLISRMSPSERRELALWYRQIAAGKPERRGYIADLIEGKVQPGVR